MDKQSQPCPRWAPQLYPHPILLPGAAQRLQPEAGAHPRGCLVPGKAAPPRLINNSPCSCIYRDGKGRGDGTAQVVSFPCLLPASQSLGKHRDVLNLAKIPGFSPTELHSKGFSPKRRGGITRVSLHLQRKDGLGKGSAIHIPCQMNPEKSLPDKSDAAGVGCFGTPGLYCSSARTETCMCMWYF